MNSQEEEPVPVFVSYSHKDQRWLDRLIVHLTPLEKEFQIVYWADTRIRPGSQWREEIRASLRRTKIAILLVSADFLASDFIRKHELPPLLSSAELEGTTILSLIVSPCRFDRTQEISKFQAVNSPDASLISMSTAEQELTFVRLSHEIEDLVIAERAARSRVLAKEGRLEISPLVAGPASGGGDIDHSPSTLGYSVTDQFAIEQNGITIAESFVEERTWAGLLKIGNWIRDESGKRIIGAGVKTYLLSQRDYGADIFVIDAELEFTNFTPPMGGKLGMNAGILFGWRQDRMEPRYFNVLLTGSTIQIEKCGFDGGMDTRDHQNVTSPVPLEILPGKPVRLRVEIDESTVKVSADSNLLIVVARPEGVIGRVGIRPWRSNVSVRAFVVESF